MQQGERASRRRPVGELFVVATPSDFTCSLYCSGGGVVCVLSFTLHCSLSGPLQCAASAGLADEFL